jgi:hypothetical protein
MHDILSLTRATDFPAPRRKRLMGLKVKLGYRRNWHCVHCQVNAGPRPTVHWDGANIEWNLVDRQPATGMFGRGSSRGGALAEDLTGRSA